MREKSPFYSAFSMRGQQAGLPENHEKIKKKDLLLICADALHY
jgi:hypothetical protein